MPLSATAGLAQGGPHFTGDTSLFQFFGYFGLFCATVLIMRVIVAILRDGLNQAPSRPATRGPRR